LDSGNRRPGHAQIAVKRAMISSGAAQMGEYSRPEKSFATPDRKPPSGRREHRTG
jgi:hypothetical protein